MRGSAHGKIVLSSSAVVLANVADRHGGLPCLARCIWQLTAPRSAPRSSHGKTIPHAARIHHHPGRGARAGRGLLTTTAVNNLPKPPDGCILHPMIKTRLDGQKHLAISWGQNSGVSLEGGGRLDGNPPSFCAPRPTYLGIPSSSSVLLVLPLTRSEMGRKARH